MDDVLAVWGRLVENAQKQPTGLMHMALVVQIFDALAAEVRALRKDRERLDWLWSKTILDAVAGWVSKVPLLPLRNEDDVLNARGFRAAIDRAMKAQIDATMSARSGEDGA